MTKFYKEFPSIEIPSFLLDWEDSSWGNDATASSRKGLPSGNDLVIWVNPDDIEDREWFDGHKFLIVLENEAGDPIREILADQEIEVLASIKSLESIDERKDY
jgi:hypothetical protein